MTFEHEDSEITLNRCSGYFGRLALAMGTLKGTNIVDQNRKIKLSAREYLRHLTLSTETTQLQNLIYREPLLYISSHGP